MTISRWIKARNRYGKYRLSLHSNGSITLRCGGRLIVGEWKWKFLTDHDYLKGVSMTTVTLPTAIVIPLYLITTAFLYY